MEQKYQPVRVLFSREEYALLRELSKKIHITKDSIVIKKLLQESREEFDEDNKSGIFVEFHRNKVESEEKSVMVYPDKELYGWLRGYASKISVSVPWMIRYIICPELKKVEESIRKGG